MHYSSPSGAKCATNGHDDCTIWQQDCWCPDLFQIVICAPELPMQLGWSWNYILTLFLPLPSPAHFPHLIGFSSVYTRIPFTVLCREPTWDSWPTEDSFAWQVALALELWQGLPVLPEATVQGSACRAHNEASSQVIPSTQMPGYGAGLVIFLKFKPRRVGNRILLPPACILWNKVMAPCRSPAHQAPWATPVSLRTGQWWADNTWWINLHTGIMVSMLVFL
jgi:hypothetical protein